MQVIDLRGAASQFADLDALLSESGAAEVASVHLAAGEERPKHQVDAVALVCALDGHARLHVGETDYDLTPGVVVRLAPGEPHHLSAVAPTTLLTIQIAEDGGECDTLGHSTTSRSEKIQEALEESFPASDPPSWNAGVKPPVDRD